MPTRPRSSIRTGPRSGGSLTAKKKASFWAGKELTNQRTSLGNILQRPLTDLIDVGQVISIHALPDDVLLPIFDSYLHEVRRNSIPEIRTQALAQAWHLLVHVCQRWRNVVFGSPRRLDLRLLCTRSTRSRDMLDIWPALPLIIKDVGHYNTGSVDNTVAALKCTDRVCEIDLGILEILDWETYLAALQQPFPELTNLDFRWIREIETIVVPDSFLGGFAPRLERLDLSGIPFPGLPKLLLSATHLVHLRLHDIPHSGYFSPDAMVAALSTLTSLKYLLLRFKSPESCPDSETRRLPPSTRSVLPVLKVFQFKGVSEYLEDIVTDIDAPQLNKLEIMLFNDIAFNTPQLIQFIGRTSMSSAPENARIALRDGTACVTFRDQIYRYALKVLIFCEGLDWQLSSLEQVCTSCSPFLSTLKDLYIHEHARSQTYWTTNIENRVWLGQLHQFTTVKNLYITEEIALRIGPALQELIEGRTTEVLPTLENIFLEGLEPSGPVQKGIGQFVAARQVSSHPIAISRWANPEEDKNY